MRIGIHGDGVHIAPLNPWLHIYYATTGINSFGDKVNGDQQLTRAEALRLFTRGNSWLLQMEEKIGSIEPGKLSGPIGGEPLDQLLDAGAPPRIGRSGVCLFEVSKRSGLLKNSAEH